MAKVVHITSVHQPFDIRIFHKECKTLAGAGHEVVLIVPHDQATSIEGVRLRPVPVPRGRRDRMTRTVTAIYRAAVNENGDIYHFHDPELIPVALLLKRRGKRVIYDVHEDRPRQMLSKHWIPPRLRGTVSRLTRITEVASGLAWDGIVAATPTIARNFPAKKTALVQNFPILDELITAEPISYRDRPAQIAYVGSLTTVRGAREMVQAMNLLPDRLGAHLDIGGVFDPPTLERELRALPGWARVTFHGWMSRPEVARLLGQTRIGLVLLHPTGNYLDAQPNKLFEYMSAGIPVVASDFPHWRSLIDADNVGLLVDPLQPQAIADAIEWLLEHPEAAEAMGKRGQETVHRRFNWQHEATQLLDFYESGFAPHGDNGIE